MIPARGVDLVAKNIQSDWDLTSSVTGTVKRRPTSVVESCKSNSPDSKDCKRLDFPKGKDDDDDVVVGSCKVNKAFKEREELHDLSQEIGEGSSSSKGIEDDESVSGGRRRKINKKLQKFSESAKKSFTSKLKLPNRVSLTLSPRKTKPPNHKLSLSQLEQQNNLFIRDGQQPNDNNGSGEKINKQQESLLEVEETQNNIIFGSRKQNVVAMERADNPKQKQETLPAAVVSSSRTEKNKKSSSLIPSFLGGSTKNTNHIKIPTASKASSTTVVEKLTKTGNKFKELYRDFPSSGGGGGEKSNPSKNSLKRNPPPYRPPPTPKQTQQPNAVVERQKRIRFCEDDAQNYEEIDVISEENVVDDRDKRVVHGDDNNQSFGNNNDDIKSEDIDEQSDECLLARPEYSSNVFKNIPVRQKKGAVSHMENYCLFDPSVDFCNEKELMKKKLAQEINAVRQIPSKSFQMNVDADESIEDVTFEDQTVYDVSEHDEREKMLAHHNYYEIDPDLLLEEGEENAVAIVENKPIIQENHHRSQSVASKNRKSKIYCNTLSTSSESTSTTSQTSTNSSSTATSSDYPSLFNSVIETTHSSTVESTDENESNGYGKVKSLTATTSTTTNESGHCGDTINQVNVTAVANESIITISNVVTCGESNASSTGATKKKSPQLNRIIRPSSSSSSSRSISSQKQSNNKQQTSSLVTKTKSSKINLPFYNKSLQLDPLKSSHSLPQLQHVTVQNRCRQQTNEINFVIDNTTTIQLRRQQNSRMGGRPLSGHSDDRDSGFLSPVTPPDSQNHPTHITPNVIIKEPESSKKSESTLLNQCDNVQQLIEVSNRNGLFFCLGFVHGFSHKELLVS